jgi:tRNA(adenine34) deaminase
VTGFGWTRRDVLLGAVALLTLGPRAVAASDRPAAAAAASRRWYEAAAAMRRLAESWGDQPYGAVLVAGGAVIGEGPSRVVQRGDPSAHAEREAIRDAQRRLGRADLSGSVLYSTSRPCRECERAAAQAKVARMVHGEALQDAGPPRP